MMTNCRSDLFREAGANRRIEAVDGRINYMYFTAGVISYCTDVPYLKDILDDKSLSPSIGEHVDKIQLRKRAANEIGGYCTLHEICLACYSGWIKSVETWPADLAKFRKYMASHHYTIDHADGNQMNNTIYNLSLMKGSINRSKNSVTSNIKLPTIHFSGRFGKEYRIIVFFPGVKCKSGKHGVLLKIRCKSATAYKDCLREIQMLGCGYGAPVFFPTDEDKYAYENRMCATSGTPDGTLYSIRYQERMARMEGRSFKWCEGKDVKKMFINAVENG